MSKRMISVLLALTLSLSLSALSAQAEREQTVVGRCTQALSADNATWSECGLGDYVTDAMRQNTGAEIAFLPGYLLAQTMPGAGDITLSRVESLFAEDLAVVLTHLTAGEIYEMLETSAGGLVLNELESIDPEASAQDSFLQVSGLTVRYDVSAPVGSRVLSVEVAGETLDPADVTTTYLTACVDTEGQETGETLVDCVASYLGGQSSATLADTDRQTVIGAHASDIISMIPVWAVALAAVIFALGGAVHRWRKEQMEEPD